MKMKKLVLLLVYACWFVGGICFFSSCQRQLDANEKIVKVSVDQADEEYLASSFIRNYKIIPLETNENCLCLIELIMQFLFSEKVVNIFSLCLKSEMGQESMSK